MSSMAEMMDVFFNGRKAQPSADQRNLVEAVRMLRGMHAKYHCKDCCCQVADFLASHPDPKGRPV